MMLPAVDGTRTYLEDQNKREKFHILEPLLIQASAVAAAPVHATVDRGRDEESEHFRFSVYRKVSTCGKVSLVLACMLIFLVFVSLGIYFAVEYSVPTNTTFQYFSQDDYFGDDYRYY